MSNVAQNGEKVFEYYLDLPILARMEILDAMQSDDRCRFTRCSKLSNKEAKASKNFIRELKLFASDQMVTIHVFHGVDAESEYGIGYSLKFKNTEEKYIECETINETKFVWRKDLDSSVDIVLYAAEIYKQLLKMYQRKIRFVSLGGAAFNGKLKNYDFEIEKLNKLRGLSLDGSINIEHVLSKILRPLEELYVCQARESFENLENLKQIYRVEKWLDLNYLKLNNEQFIQLSASNVNISIGYLTIENIFQFIKSWQCGTIGKKVEMYEWYDLESNGFDAAKLFRLFGMSHEDSQGEKLELEIKHHKDGEQSAKLSYFDKFDGILSFVVKNDNGKYPQTSQDIASTMDF